MLELKQLGAGFGLEAGGVDLSRALPEAQFHEIEQAFYASQVLVFRTQKLAAGESKIFIEAQRKAGYQNRFLVAITAQSAVLAVIIPRSILMIACDGLLTVSVGGLFLADIGAGLPIGLAQMATVQVYATLRNCPTCLRATLRETIKGIGVAVPTLVTPAIIWPDVVLFPPGAI